MGWDRSGSVSSRFSGGQGQRRGVHPLPCSRRPAGRSSRAPLLLASFGWRRANTRSGSGITATHNHHRSHQPYRVAHPATSEIAVRRRRRCSTTLTSPRRRERRRSLRYQGRLLHPPTLRTVVAHSCLQYNVFAASTGCARRLTVAVQQFLTPSGCLTCSGLRFDAEQPRQVSTYTSGYQYRQPHRGNHPAASTSRQPSGRSSATSPERRLRPGRGPGSSTSNPQSCVRDPQNYGARPTSPRPRWPALQASGAEVVDALHFRPFTVLPSGRWPNRLPPAARDVERMAPTDHAERLLKGSSMLEGLVRPALTLPRLRHGPIHGSRPSTDPRPVRPHIPSTGHAFGMSVRTLRESEQHAGTNPPCQSVISA